MTIWGKRADMIVHQLDPYNAESPPASLVDDHVTATDAFYARNHGPVPETDADVWRVRVEGLVDTPMELDLSELHARFDEHTITATLQCAGNRRSGLLDVRAIPGEHPWGSGATSNATWTGVRLADVLDAAGVQPSTRHVWFAGPDIAPAAKPPQPFGASITIDKAESPEVLLAWAMNGEPLTAVHGAPVRVVVPGWIGARSVKWVREITAAAHPSDNYFQAKVYRVAPPDAEDATDARWPSLGPVALSSAILCPADGSTVPAGSVDVTGYAYAGEARTVTRVDVSTDGGSSWRQAEVDEPDGPWTWQHWRTAVHLSAGAAKIVARAWDSTGALQPTSAADVWNPKGYANYSWARCTVNAQ